VISILRPRWSMVGLSVGVSAIVYVVLGVAATAVTRGPLWMGVIIGVIFAAVTSPFTAMKIRRRSLIASASGLIAQRDTYRVSCSWDDAVEIRARKLGGVLPVDEIVFRQGTTEAVDSRGKRRKGVAGKVAKMGADRRIQVGVYDASWREGPIGESLATAGLPLDPS
jgi:hypothetical protein